jgi:hypothetical protein
VPAHSAKEIPIHFYDFIDTPTIELIPKSWSSQHLLPSHKEENRIADTSSFRLSFRAFNKTYSLHMDPNPDLFHSDTYKDSIPYLVKPFRGVVHSNDMSQTIMTAQKQGLISVLASDPKEIGDARITVHQDGERTSSVAHSGSRQGVFFQNPLFEGIFTIGDDMFHIKDIETYQLTKSPQDPEVASISTRRAHQRTSKMIIYRNSDYKPESVSSSSEKECSNRGKPFLDTISAERIQKAAHGLHKRQDIMGCKGPRKIAYVVSAGAIWKSKVKY